MSVRIRTGFEDVLEELLGADAVILIAARPGGEVVYRASGEPTEIRRAILRALRGILERLQEDVTP